MGNVKLTKEKPKITHVLLLIDSSGSMTHLRMEVVDSFNRQIASIRDESRRSGSLRTDVSVWHFAQTLSQIVVGRDVEEPMELSLDDYEPGGGTALIDSVVEAVGKVESARQAFGSDDSYLLVVLTDGYENSSSRKPSKLRELLLGLQATDRWTVVFQGPPRSRDVLLSYGVPAGNIREWEASARGLESATQKTNSSYKQFFAARAQGVRSTRSFYTTDLSNLKKTDLNILLNDVRQQYHKWTVDKECQVSDFVGHKTGRPYVPGSTFYQLTKPEDLLPDREVLVQDRLDGSVYAGSNARNVLNIPSGAGVVVRLKPGNHANYSIYLQSRSTNRKLVRGTTVLVKKY